MRIRSTVISLSIVLATALYAHHGPTSIVIKAAAKKQPPVTFSHSKHATTLVKTCESCHHTQKGLTAESKIDVVKCTNCHLDPKDPKIPSMREMSMTKNPFHERCIDCHKTQKKGPVACNGCHKKA